MTTNAAKLEKGVAEAGRERVKAVQSATQIEAIAQEQAATKGEAREQRSEVADESSQTRLNAISEEKTRLAAEKEKAKKDLNADPQKESWTGKEKSDLSIVDTLNNLTDKIRKAVKARLAEAENKQLFANLGLDEQTYGTQLENAFVEVIRNFAKTDLNEARINDYAEKTLNPKVIYFLEQIIKIAKEHNQKPLEILKIFSSLTTGFLDQNGRFDESKLADFLSIEKSGYERMLGLFSKYLETGAKEIDLNTEEQNLLALKAAKAESDGQTPDAQQLLKTITLKPQTFKLPDKPEKIIPALQDAIEKSLPDGYKSAPKSSQAIIDYLVIEGQKISDLQAGDTLELSADGKFSKKNAENRQPDQAPDTKPAAAAPGEKPAAAEKLQGSEQVDRSTPKNATLEKAVVALKEIKSAFAKRSFDEIHFDKWDMENWDWGEIVKFLLVGLLGQKMGEQISHFFHLGKEKFKSYEEIFQKWGNDLTQEYRNKIIDFADNAVQAGIKQETVKKLLENSALAKKTLDKPADISWETIFSQLNDENVAALNEPDKLNPDQIAANINAAKTKAMQADTQAKAEAAKAQS